MAEKSKSSDRWWVGPLILLVCAVVFYSFLLKWSTSNERDKVERIRVQTLCEFQGGTFISDGNLCVAGDGFISIEEKK